MNKKPISVQFKFWESLDELNAPTEPRTPIVQTMEIPAQEQRKLSKAAKRHRMPTGMTLVIVAGALVVCGSLLLFIVLHRH